MEKTQDNPQSCQAPEAFILVARCATFKPRNQPTHWLIFVGRPWFLEAFGVLYFHDPCLKPAFKNDECDKPKHIIPCFFFSWPWLSMAFENSFGNFGYMEYGLKFALPQAHPAAESQLRRPTRFPSPHPSEHPSQPRYTRKPWWVSRIQTGKWRRNGCGEHTKHQAFEHNVEMKGNGST